MILPIFLGLASLSTPPADHRTLHPRDAMVYVAMPDVPSMVSAYGQAPLFRLCADEKVHEALAPFGVKPESLDLAQKVREAIAGLTGGPQNADLVQGIAALSFSMTLDPANPDPSQMGMELVVDYQSADMASKAESLLRQSFGSEDESGALELTLHGMKVPGWCSADQTRFFLGAGSCTFESAIARSSAKEKGLDSDELYTSTGKSLAPSSGTTIAEGFLRMSPWTIAMHSNNAPETVRALAGAFDPLPGPTSFRMSLADGRFVTKTFSATKEAPGVLGVAPVDPAWLGLVPPGVMFVYGGTLDAPKLAHLLKDVMGQLGADEEMARNAEQALPIFEKLGPNLVMFSDPVGGLGLPPAFLWAELKSTDGFQDQFATALTSLTAGSGIEVSTREYKVKNETSGERVGIPITTLKLPEGMGEGPLTVSPSFAVVDGKLLASHSATQIKRELKRIYGGETTEGVNPLQASGFSLPKDARSVVVMDWGSLIEGLLSLAKTLGGMMGALGGAEGGLPFDPSQLPPAEIFTRFFQPTIHYSTRNDAGLARHHQASFGPETWAGLMAAGFAAQQQFGQMGGMGGSIPMEEVGPATEPPR